MDNKEIYEALITLKRCCEEINDCTRCPLSVGKNPCKCKVSNSERGIYPSEWELNDEFDYKAFKEK